MRKKSEYWSHPDGAPQHPYVRFEGTAVWKAVKKALIDLDRNQDIELTEWHQYVVGYVCKQLDDDALLTETARAKRVTRQSRKRS